MKISEIASGLQFPEGPIALDDGSVMLVEIARGTLSRVRARRRRASRRRPRRRPERRRDRPRRRGLRLQQRRLSLDHRDRRLPPSDRPGRRLLAAAASSASTSRTGRFERLYDTVEGLGLRGPNDIVFDAHGGFYFTDLGKVRPTEIDRGGVFYATSDGGARASSPGR